MTKISVIQPGARLHYAVPLIFAKHKILNFLYTDLHSNHGYMKFFLHFTRIFKIKNNTLIRMLGRSLPRELNSKYVKDIAFIKLFLYFLEMIKLINYHNNIVDKILLNILENDEISRGDLIYTVIVNEDIEVMKRLKGRGAKIIHECMMSPKTAYILEEEYKLHPHFIHKSNIVKMRQDSALDKEKFELADLILVPSNFCKSGVIETAHQCKPNISIVPYGLDLTRFEYLPATPKLGRVLFVGNAPLRKGLHYFAEASRILARSNKNIEFIAIGPDISEVARFSIFNGPTYLGRVPRSEVHREFLKADIFVLPTLSEGFALVHLEALACGLPVITTENCGSIIRDGIDGFIIPIRDPYAICEKIELLIGDRCLRAQMSISAIERSKEFSIEKYSDRLMHEIGLLTKQ